MMNNLTPDEEAKLAGKGPNYREMYSLLKQRVAEGLQNIHVSWGPKAAEMTEEERCRYVIDNILNRLADEKPSQSYSRIDSFDD